MKTLYTFLFLILGFGAASAQSYVFDSVGVKSIEIGTVVIKNDTWVIKVDKANFTQYYLPVNLPEKYCINNQEVVFEGAIGRIPTNVKMVGTPLKLSMIRVLYRTKPNPNNGETLSEEKVSQALPDPDSVGFISNANGKIIAIGDVFLIEQEINGETKRYVPDFLPQDFLVANTAITFSATILKSDPNVRMMGTPIKIKDIKSESTEQFDAQKIQDAVKDLFPFDSVGFLPETKGTIKLIAGTFVIEVDNGRNDITRYLPVMLPEDFKKRDYSLWFQAPLAKYRPMYAW
jgi:hypothetical protein